MKHRSPLLTEDRVKTRQQTSSPATALRRLIEELAKRGIKVELRTKRGTKGKSIVVRRDGRRRVVEFWPHTSKVNLDLLWQLARASTSVGGGGMGHREIQGVTGYSILGFDFEARPRRRGRTPKAVAA